MGETMRRAELLAIGWSSDELTDAVRRGELYRPAPGMYRSVGPEPDWLRYRHAVLAAATRRAGVISHESAAALHDIPYLRPERDAVHFTIARNGGGGRRGGVHLHPRPLTESEVTVVEGALVTSRARTAVDIATSGDLERAVCAIDAVRLLRRLPRPDDPAPVPLDELRQCLERLGRRRGSATARRALDRSVEQSESAGESWSRMQMLSAGLPAPRLQMPYLLDGQRFYADFTWGSLIGEFDGRGKYGDDLAERGDALDQEKSRQEAFEAAGFDVIRWGWRALRTPGRLRALLEPGLRRHGLLRAA